MRGTKEYNYKIYDGKIDVDTAGEAGLDNLVLTIKSEKQFFSKLSIAGGTKASLFNKVDKLPDNCK